MSYCIELQSVKLSFRALNASELASGTTMLEDSGPKSARIVNCSGNNSASLSVKYDFVAQ